MHEPAVRTVAALLRAEERLVITPQIVAEFWSVATRPVENNGLGWSHQQALTEIIRIEGFFSLLIESTEVYSEWKRLVTAYSVTGVQAHDARLVAAMKVYDVSRILTFNVHYLPNLSDGWFLDQLRVCDIHLATGNGPWEDSSHSYRLGELLWGKGIPAHVDDWGGMGGHDWPYWKYQMREYLERLY